MYEDAISVIGSEPDQPKLPSAPAAPGKYAETINGMGDLSLDAARLTSFSANTSNPDKAARALELSRRFGVPPQAVEADLPRFEAQAKITDNSAELKASPMLSSWIAANPEAARIAHDDFQNMGFLSKTIHAARSGWDQGTIQDQMARENARQLMTLGEEIKETDRERQLKALMAKPDGVDGGFYNTVKHVSSFFSGVGSQLKGAAAPAIGGAAVGSAVPGVGTGTGAAAGFTAGMVKEGFETGAGQIYNELKNLRDVDGAPVDPALVKGAALTGGLALGFLNALNIRYMNKPFVDAMSSMIPGLAKKTIERPTISKALTQFGKNMAGGTLVGMEFGLMSQMLMSGSVELAKHFDSSDKWETIFNSEAQRERVLNQIVDSMESTALAFAVMHAPPSSVSLGMEIARARRATQHQEFIKNLADGSASSKVRDRSPSMFENFIASQTDGTPVENLYLPAEVVMKLYQDHGIDPKDRATDHLFPFQKDIGQQLEQALPVKGDVVIRTADYATHLAGTEVDKALRKDLKVGADAMSVNEAKTFFQEIQKELGERQKELKADNDKPEAAGDKIRAEVAKQLEEAGYKPRTAGGMAAQMAAFFSTIGKRLGIDPMDLFQRYGLKIQRDMGSKPEGAMEQPVYHGSPHVFDEFKLQRIGTGEGAQSYGWGLYFASNKKVAQWYRSKLAGTAREIHVKTASSKETINLGTHAPDNADYQAFAVLTKDARRMSGFVDIDFREAVQYAKVRAEMWRSGRGSVKDVPEARREVEAQMWDDVIARIEAWQKRGKVSFERKEPGRLYHVDIPEHDNYLDLDKPFSEQSDIVKKAIESDSMLQDMIATRGGESVGKMTGGELYRMLSENAWDEQHLSLYGEDTGSILNSNRIKGRKLTKQEVWAIQTLEHEEVRGNPTAAIEFLQKEIGEHEDTIHEVRRVGGGDKDAAQVIRDAEDGIKEDKSAIEIISRWVKDDAIELSVSPEEMTSKHLLKAGIPGLSYLEGASRGKGKGNYNYVLFDDSLAKITGYEQEGGVKELPRGYITFGADRKVSIGLLEKADLSTFLHESGHFYLEVLRDLSAGKMMNEGMTGDIKALFDYLGVKDWKDIGVEHHEKFARSFEAYLMEGKAPSRELRGAFARFKNWLTTIYEKVINLGVNLTPEVRQVFDRMLATDEEIMAARRAQRLEAMFSDAKAAGMTDVEFSAYRRAVNRVTEDADDKLLAKTMEDVRRTRTKEWKVEERQVREEEGKKVDARPDVSALHFLRTGELLDGRKDVPAMRLSRQALEDAYGADILADLPRGRPGRPLVVDGKDGAHPDDVAQLFGYPSGDAMVKALVSLERKFRREQAKGDRRTIRDMLADEATERRMKKEHGDMLDDGEIRDEAMNVLHSTGQAEVLATELRALSRTQKDSRPLPLSVARDWAKSVVESRTVQDASKYFRYARDEAKAGRAVMRAFAAGDQAEAMRQKQLQLLNHVLYMEAKRVSDEVDVAHRRLDSYASARVLRSVDPDYLDQVHQLLERFDFATASDKEVERRESLARWITRTEADGNEVKIDDKLRSEAFRKHFSKLTVNEFRGLVDAADNIIHIGKLKNQLTDLGQKRDLFEVVADAVAQVSQLRTIIPPEQRNPGVGGKGLDRLEAKWLKLKSGLKSMDAALLKMEQVFDWLDQGDSNGVFNRIVFKRIADAGIVEHDLRKQIADSLRSLNKRMPKDFFKDFNTRYEVPELIDSRTGKASQLLKSEILAIALNVGNLSNFDKMLRGEKWSESAVKAVLDRHMTKADWEFVQGTWDTIGELWPKIAKLERDLTGVAPEKIEPREVETLHGKFKGGYYPVVYDPLRSFDVELNRQRAADELFERQYVRATTQHGHTTERAQPYARPLYLSLEVIPRHLQQVTHDLAYREAIMDADKFLSNPKIRKAVEDTLGREVYTQFRPWLQAIANDKVYDQRGLAWWDRAAHWARTSGTMVGLGFRMTTMLIHGATAASNSIGELGPKWMMSGMNAFFGTPEKMAAARDFIFERSGEMRHRMNDVDRDVRDGLSELEGKHGVIYAARRFAYYGISALDMASALPTWMGAYNKAMHSGMSEEQAIYAADKSVRVAHGGGHIKDLPAVMRGTEWQKLFTMFYSFWSHFYNRQRHMGRQMVEAGRDLADGEFKKAAHDFSMVLARSVFYFILPQIIHATLRNKSKDEEDKSWLHLASEEIAMGFFAGIPVLRDIAHSVFLGRDYEATPAAQIVKSFIATGKDLAAAAGATDSEVSDKWVRHAMETTGYTFGLPLGQPAGTVQFMWDVINGNQSPDGVTDWLHGIIYGKLPQGG